MAKIPQGILGGVSGKIGGIVGSSWKGINVIKTKPLSVANPKTVPQVAQRTMFKQCTIFASSILSDFIKPYWDRFAVKMSGYNAFVRKNVELFSGDFPSYAASIVIGDGVMSADVLSAIAPAAGDTDISVSWVVSAQPKFKAGNDLADHVWCYANGTIAGTNTGSATREDESCIIELSRPLVEGEVLHGYMVTRRADGTVVSRTSYATTTVTA